MNDEFRLPPEVEAALIKSDALSNVIASRVTYEDHDRDGFAEEIAVLQELRDEANTALERVKQVHSF